MANFLSAFIILTVNTTHILFYLRLATRNPLRFLPVYLGFPFLMTASMRLGTLFPDANGVLMPACLFCCAGLLRLLVTKDGFSRILFCIASVLAFSQIIRTPIFLAMVQGLGWSTEEATINAVFIYPVVFLLLTPFLLRCVREPLGLILDVAETQKWYLVCLPPLILTSIGDMVHFPGEGMTDAFKVRSIGMLMPVCVAAYFVSIYLFMVGQRDKLVLNQRLAAAERLEETYKFYDSRLSEKETRLQRLRHDFRHLVVHLEELARNWDRDGILRELGEMSAASSQTAIKPFCENRTVNAIVSSYFAQAEERGVNCVAKAFVPENLAIPKADLSMALGNALENCVKGAGALGTGGYIIFDAKPGKGYMVFDFINNYMPDSYSKGKGVGLASLKHVCEQYDGRMEVSDKDGEFRLAMFLRAL